MEMDNQLENQGAVTSQSSEEMLRVVTQELQSLKENLLSQLSQELSEMRAERSRLGEEIEQMRSQQSQQWQSQPPQSDQQQLWAQQLAQILASHLQERLKQQLSQSATEAPSNSENAYKLISSVDSTLGSTLKSLQQDVSSYQSAIAQQLGRMQSMEQQGEAILEALVSRLKYQLQDVAVQRATVTIHPHPQPTIGRSAEVAVSTPSPAAAPPPESPPAALPAALPPAVAIAPPALNTGFFLILLSFVMLSLQNIATRIILTKKPVFLLGNLGGFVQPTAGNALLILLMRMLIELPLIFLVARLLYPRAWREIRQLFNSSRRNSLRWLFGAGTALFVSQFCFYMALGNLPTGVATTLFFIYPTVVILADWQLFGTRPNLSLSLATVSIYLGGFLAIPLGQRLKEGNLWLGVATVIAAGIALAIYVLLTRICAQKLKLHPLPFRIVDCTTMLALSALSIEAAKFFPLKYWQYNVPDKMWNTLWIWTGILALSTLASLLLNHFGFRKMGGTFAPLLGASVPMLTTLMAWVFLRENLQPMQAIGIAIVTMWVLGISAENMKQMAAKRASSAR